MRRSTALTFQMIKTSRIPTALKIGLGGLGAAGTLAGLGYLSGGLAGTEGLGSTEEMMNPKGEENPLNELYAASNKLIQDTNREYAAIRNPEVHVHQSPGPLVVDTSDIFSAGPAMGREIMRRISRTYPGSGVQLDRLIGIRGATQRFFDDPFAHAGTMASPLSLVGHSIRSNLMGNVAGPKETMPVLDISRFPRMRDYIGFSNNVGREKPNRTIAPYSM